MAARHILMAIAVLLFAQQARSEQAAQNRDDRLRQFEQNQGINFGGAFSIRNLPTGAIKVTSSFLDGVILRFDATINASSGQVTMLPPEGAGSQPLVAGRIRALSLLGHFEIPQGNFTPTSVVIDPTRLHLDIQATAPNSTLDTQLGGFIDVKDRFITISNTGSLSITMTRPFSPSGALQFQFTNASLSRLQLAFGEAEPPIALAGPFTLPGQTKWVLDLTGHALAPLECSIEVKGSEIALPSMVAIKLQDWTVAITSIKWSTITLKQIADKPLEINLAGIRASATTVSRSTYPRVQGVFSAPMEAESLSAFPVLDQGVHVKTWRAIGLKASLNAVDIIDAKNFTITNMTSVDVSAPRLTESDYAADMVLAGGAVSVNVQDGGTVKTTLKAGDLHLKRTAGTEVGTGTLSFDAIKFDIGLPVPLGDVKIKVTEQVTFTPFPNCGPMQAHARGDTPDMTSSVTVKAGVVEAVSQSSTAHVEVGNSFYQCDFSYPFHRDGLGRIDYKYPCGTFLIDKWCDGWTYVVPPIDISVDLRLTVQQALWDASAQIEGLRLETTCGDTRLCGGRIVKATPPPLVAGISPRTNLPEPAKTWVNGVLEGASQLTGTAILAGINTALFGAGNLGIITLKCDKPGC